jgi:ribose transport system permease protein
MMLQAGVPIWIAVIVSLAFGAALGCVHGFGVRKMGMPPFIMTLATLTSLRGLGFLITGGNSVSGLPPAFTGFSRLTFLGIPSLFWVVILVAVCGHVFLRHSRWGRYIYAVGSNAEATRLSGINITQTVFTAYIISGTLAALAGVLTASRLSVGLAFNGDGDELRAIAASVIGGTSLFGAIGNVSGPLLGAITLATIANGANLLDVNPYWERIVTGLLIVAIVFVDQLRHRRR